MDAEKDLAGFEAWRKLLLDLQGYFSAEQGADRYYRDYNLKERVSAALAQAQGAMIPCKANSNDATYCNSVGRYCDPNSRCMIVLPRAAQT